MPIFPDCQFALDGIFNEILWAKTNKLMGKGKFDNLVARESLKNFTCGQKFA